MIDSKIPRLLLTANILLAACVLLASSPTLAGDNVLPAPKTPAPLQKGLIMPPEVEALFPEGECQISIWRNWNRAIDYNQHPQRDKYHDVNEDFTGICLDQRINVNLYGGSYFMGLYVAPPHPDHPHSTKFGTVTRWEKVNSIDYIPILKAKLIDAAIYADGKNSDIERTWIQYGPCYKILMKKGLFFAEKGRFDIDSDGVDETIYRDTLPSLLRKNINGEYGYLWNYYIYDKCAAKESFNNREMTAEPLRYDGKVYWIKGKKIYSNNFLCDAINNKRVWYLGSMCQSEN